MPILCPICGGPYKPEGMYPCPACEGKGCFICKNTGKLCYYCKEWIKMKVLPELRKTESEESDPIGTAAAVGFSIGLGTGLIHSVILAVKHPRMGIAILLVWISHTIIGALIGGVISWLSTKK